MKLEFETIYNEMESERFDQMIKRAKVFGGWIVSDIIESLNENKVSSNMIFISDPNHEWSLND